jgi:hypothetical protein
MFFLDAILDQLLCVAYRDFCLSSQLTLKPPGLLALIAEEPSDILLDFSEDVNRRSLCLIPVHFIPLVIVLRSWSVLHIA